MIARLKGVAAVFVAAVFAVGTIAGCATNARPLPITPRVALTPPKDDLAVQARVGKPIGGVVPVDLSIANGTDEPYLIDPAQVFAIDQEGQKILPIPPAEAIQEAGDANSLKAGFTGAAKSAAVGGLAGAAIGAALGAVVGTMFGVPPIGAAFGAAIGGGIGASASGAVGGLKGQAAAHEDAANQINALCLQSGQAHPNYSVNGYVFFPKGSYQSVQINLLNEEDHQTRTMIAAWSDANGHYTASTSQNHFSAASPAPGPENPTPLAAPPQPESEFTE